MENRMAKKENSEPEELDVEGEEIEEQEALVTYDITSYPADLTLWGIREMWEQGDIIIPDFQRNYVWTMAQASLLIESFLVGLPVPQVFLYIDEKNKSLVIDGQQRILSCVYFFEGFFGDENTQGKRQVFRLTGLDPRSPYANLRYEDLSEPDQRKLRGAVLRAINIRQLSPKTGHTSIYHIFERLNTGGTPLKAQEIRNCVFRGELVTVLKDLNRNPDWRKILGKKTFDKHQKDVELVLRVFALSGRGWKSYEKPMKEFLNRAMVDNRDAKSKKVRDFVPQFEKAVRILARDLGSKPFHVRGPLNSSALDSVMSVVIDGVDRVPMDLDRRYDQLKRDTAFMQATSYGTSDVPVLQTRFERARLLLLDQGE
jgi:hypothetical protein